MNINNAAGTEYRKGVIQKMDAKMDESLRKLLPTLQSMEHDTAALRARFNRSKGEVAVTNLRKNHFEAYYAQSREEAADILYDLVPHGATIGCGDSHTLFALQIEDRLISEKDCTFIPHLAALNRLAQSNETQGNQAVGTKEQMRELLMRYLVSDVFMLGANAISMDGQIVNVDACGNRVAGSMYGPDRIIVIAGINKLTPDLQSAHRRVGFIAAPMNNLKYNETDMPCVKTGDCRDCRSEQRLCNITTVIHKKPTDADFHVIIVGEELGY
jgi:L-lactate utilization protein LutB